MPPEDLQGFTPIYHGTAIHFLTLYHYSPKVHVHHGAMFPTGIEDDNRVRRSSKIASALISSADSWLQLEQKMTDPAYLPANLPACLPTWASGRSVGRSINRAGRQAGGWAWPAFPPLIHQSSVSDDNGHGPMTGAIREAREILAFGHALMHTYACAARNCTPFTTTSLSPLGLPSEPCALALGHFFRALHPGLREHLPTWAHSCNP